MTSTNFLTAPVAKLKPKHLYNSPRLRTDLTSVAKTERFLPAINQEFSAAKCKFSAPKFEFPSSEILLPYEIFTPDPNYMPYTLQSSSRQQLVIIVVILIS